MNTRNVNIEVDSIYKTLSNKMTQNKNPTEKIEWTVERYRKNWALDTQGRETKQNHNKET